MTSSPEVWKDIPGYEGAYQASTLGRIRSVDRVRTSRNRYTGLPYERRFKGQILRPGQFCKSGHVSVVLGRGTAGKPVHQLIMQTFVGPCPKGMEVLHKNGNPKDNRLENLRYGTRRENILDVYYQGKAWRRITLEQAKEIKAMLAQGFSNADIIARLGVTQAIVSSIRHGRSYTWLDTP